MAAAGSNATLQGLQGKKQVVHRLVSEALGDLLIQEETRGVEITLSRYSIIYMGVCDSNLLEAAADDWNRVLSEGIGTKFNVGWYRNKYSMGDLRVLRLGEPIFEVMRARGLNPQWDGTRAGEFTVTAVDDIGAKLAVAMALQPRLGCDSPLFLVSALVFSQRTAVQATSCRRWPYRILYRGASLMRNCPPPL